MGSQSSHLPSNSVNDSNIGKVSMMKDFPSSPPPRPSRKKKNEIFDPENFKIIDERAASVPISELYSYSALLDTLTNDLTTDLQIVRSIFIWLGSQNLQRLDGQEYDLTTPIGYLRAMKARRGSYHELFSILCYLLRIPCVTVKGYGKGARYEVGDQDIEKCLSSWNCVYINGEWRIIHCHWAFTGLVGFNQGTWSMIDAQRGSGQLSSSGCVVYQIEEFYFLPDPEVFRHFCLPFEGQKMWQLTDDLWTLEDFVNVPLYREAYFLHQITAIHNPTAVIHTLNGKVKLRFTIPTRARLIFTHRLYHAVDNKSNFGYTESNCSSFIATNKNEITFHACFSVTGIYKLCLMAGWHRPDIVAEFRIECSQPYAELQPLPKMPLIGFGYTWLTKACGLENPSDYHGVVSYSSSNPKKSFSFTMAGNIDVLAKLYHVFWKKKKLQECVSTAVLCGNNVAITVMIPGELQGQEIILEINARDVRHRRPYKNICNYLLVPMKEEMEKISARRNVLPMKKITVNSNPEDKSIEAEKLNHELKNAISRQDIDTMEKVIEKFKALLNGDKAQPILQEAEKVCSQLKKIDRLKKEMMNLKPTSITEIHHYKQPVQITHDVMMATYILLGENREELEDWSTIRTMMRTKGKKGLMKRISDFNIVSVSEKQVSEVCEVLKRCDLEKAKCASVGTAAFYAWCDSIMGELS